MEAKWSITIGKKKRGYWRPPITIRIWIEGGEGNPLNIRPDYAFPIVKDKAFEERAKGCMKHNCSSFKDYAAGEITAPVSLFRNDKHGNQDWLLCRCSCYDGNRCVLCKSFPKVINIFNGYEIVIYPEWRPGVPNYVDVYEWLRDTLVQPCVDEYNRRIAEAMESIATEEIVYTSDDLRIQKAVEETKKVSRRLKVA